MLICSFSAWIRIAGYVIMETNLYDEWYGYLTAWTLNTIGYFLSATAQILSIRQRRTRVRNSSVSKSSNKREADLPA